MTQNVGDIEYVTRTITGHSGASYVCNGNIRYLF